jgi:hypothetical protein
MPDNSVARRRAQGENVMTETTAKKRGRKSLPEDQKRETKNITVDADLIEVINNVADKLEAAFGFRPTLSQTLRHLIKEATK